MNYRCRTENNETGAQYGSGCATPGGLQGQKHERCKKDSADGREHAHGDIRDARLEVVLADLLEVEIAIEARQPAGQRNKHLSQRRVDIHEEFALDVFRSETTEAGEQT